MKRFAIHPGIGRDTPHGQTRFINSGRLIELYGLAFLECVIVYGSANEAVDPELMPLFPLPDGRYKEFLENRKYEDFWSYVKAKKLYIHHTLGVSARRGAMRRAAAERQAKSIAWHEKHWPDFPAVYARYAK